MSKESKEPSKEIKHIKTKMAALLAGLAATAMVLVPAMAAPPTEPQIDAAPTYVQTREAPAQSATPLTEEASVKKPAPNELSQWTNDDKAVQSAREVNGDVTGGALQIQDTLTPPSTASFAPVATAVPTATPSATQDEMVAEEAADEATEQASDSDLEESTSVEEEVTASSDGALEEETITEEDDQAAEGVSLQEETKVTEPLPSDDSLQVTDNIQGEEMTEDIESLMYQPVETRVGLLQEKLMQLGYMEEAPVPQVYDALTQLGVMYFQRNHGLEVTGIADDATTDLVMSGEAQPYMISLGSEGEDVRQLQNNLASLGHAVAVTGNFDAETETAVIAFKQMKAMEATGIVDMAVKKAIAVEAALHGMVSSTANPGVEQMIAVAEAQLGKPYVLGAKGADAFDCSGLVYYCLNQSGYQIGYMTSGEWANAPYTTISSMSELQRGDIVCFQGHVGIYIGDGRMIDASSSQAQVRVSTDIQSSGYWVNSFICAKRVF